MVIDLNSDLGESFGHWTLGQDAELMKSISSANVACGYHAGDPVVMRDTVRMARDRGVAAARQGLLKIKQDRRVPMMEVYALYGGKLTPDDVLKATEAGSPSTAELNARRFYAHLYLGLYYEVSGDAASARKHIDIAAREHKIGHYMWNVADMHARRLAAEKHP